jgi:pimeloyl-ACP methyl ester carboxylesterase
MPITSHDVGGSLAGHVTVYFSHATGFCGAVWDPVRSLLEDIETVAWDHPGHGGGPEVRLPVDWRIFGEHVLDVTEPGGVGVGHSMGAAALAMAQIADPNRFRALLLVEPIVFPGPFQREERYEMAETAMKRKPVFESRESAASHFRDRGAFVGWVEEAFDGYIRCALVGDDEVRLACSPEVEADIYRGWKAHDTWDNLDTIDIPVLVMTGEQSETITPHFARDQAARFGHAGLEVVPGAGHFLTMQLPDLVARRVRRLVEMG